MQRTNLLFSSLALTLLFGCGGDPEGDLYVNVYGGESIEQGAQIDGWSLTFDRFVVLLKYIELRHEAAPEIKLANPRVFDLHHDSQGEGHRVAKLTTKVGAITGLDFTIAPDPAARAENTGDSQAENLAENQWSIYIEGSATKGDQNLTFSWGFPTNTAYLNCSTEAFILENEAGQVQITLPGQQLFAESFDDNAPLAFDPLAQADTNMDTKISQAELEALAISSQQRFSPGSREDISTLYDMLAAQAASLGQIDGQASCTTE